MLKTLKWPILWQNDSLRPFLIKFVTELAQIRYRLVLSVTIQSNKLLFGIPDYTFAMESYRQAESHDMIIVSNLMKRKYTVLITLCLVIFAIAVVYRLVNMHHPTITTEPGISGEQVAIYNVSPDGIITVNDSLRFRFDTGTASSTITKDDIRRLRNMGIKVTSRKFPVVARSAFDEDIFLAKGSFLVDIPFYTMRHYNDHAHYGHYESTGKLAGYLKDMIFLPAEETDTISTIGIDMLEHFTVEISEANKAVTLRLSVPDNYQYVMDLERSRSVFGSLSDAHRFYMPITVQNRKNSYRIDTGLQSAELKLVADDSVRANCPLRTVMLSTARGVAPAKYAESIWVKLGDRQGSYGAHYSDEGIDDYAINPLNFFDQDIVIDFPGRRFYLHPRSNLIVDIR